ncbi:uncharacterized protein MONOS_17450 [Monocercomonoides exilis]|uniref:uncharacterized protein n=1 Tax=Monocercomonoides exilis TaxID=2049356 RepID=UPI00355A827D|nr:hypothetical protein MONOS_17450 [Monocercomonoides exilis]
MEIEKNTYSELSLDNKDSINSLEFDDVECCHGNRESKIGRGCLTILNDKLCWFHKSVDNSGAMTHTTIQPITIFYSNICLQGVLKEDIEIQSALFIQIFNDDESEDEEVVPTYSHLKEENKENAFEPKENLETSSSPSDLSIKNDPSLYWFILSKENAIKASEFVSKMQSLLPPPEDESSDGSDDLDFTGEGRTECCEDEEVKFSLDSEK